MGFIRRIAVGLEKLDESPIQSDKMEVSAAPEGLSVKRLVELIEQEA
jgi:hypothetical protein